VLSNSHDPASCIPICPGATVQQVCCRKKALFGPIIPSSDLKRVASEASAMNRAPCANFVIKINYFYWQKIIKIFAGLKPSSNPHNVNIEDISKFSPRKEICVT
jgi:hypothetical protein